MKKFLIATLALTSVGAFADVDYSRCTMMSGYQIDHDGRVQAGMGQTIKSQRTVGNKETIVFESSFGNQKFTNEVVFERDAQGRVIRMTSGGERPSAAQMKSYRDMMVNSSVTMAGFQSGMNEQGTTNFMAQEPSYFLRKRSAGTGENSFTNSGSQGTTTAGATSGSGTASLQGIYPGTSGDYEMVPLSRLTQDQAKEVGIENMEELRRLRQQWRRDKRSSQRLRQGYQAVVDRSSLVIPMGMDTEFDIADGVCLPKTVSSRFYNSQTREVTSVPVSSRANCEKVQAVYRRNERKITECNEANNVVRRDYMNELYPRPATAAGGTETGSATGGTHGGAYLGGGLAGGMTGGYVGGFGGGMGIGMYGGYGMGLGMYGMYGNPYMGGDMSSISMQNMMCEWTYNRDRQTQAQRNATGSGSTVIGQ